MYNSNQVLLQLLRMLFCCEAPDVFCRLQGKGKGGQICHKLANKTKTICWEVLCHFYEPTL